MLVLSFESFKHSAQKNKKPLNFYPHVIKYATIFYVVITVLLSFFNGFIRNMT